MQELNKGGPSFIWKQSPTDEQHIVSPHDAEPEHVVTTIKSIMQALLNKTAGGITSTIRQIPHTTHSAETTTISDMAIGVEETTNNSSIITEILQSNNTLINADTTVRTHNTVITLMNNATNNTNFVMETSITTDESGISTTEIDSTITGNIVNTITDSVTSIVSFSSDETYSYTEHNIHYIEEKTLYIILGVLLAALILIIIILMIVYKKYKNTSHERSQIYCVTDLNEIRISDVQHT